MVKISTTLTRSFVIIITVLVVITSCGVPSANVVVSGQNDTAFIEAPGEIPWFDNWDTPVIEPGDSGFLEFSVENRYNSNFRPNDLTDVELTLSIYEYATLDENRKVNPDFDNQPELVESIPVENAPNAAFDGNRGIITVEPGTGVAQFRITWPVLRENSTYFIKIKITTEDTTPEGSYSVRTELKFMHAGIENRTFVMRSLGYFTREEYDFAKATATEDSPGDINISALGVDGIVPETSFTVRRPVPFWPFYILAALTVLFAVMAVVFYYMEEHGKFQGLKARLERRSRR